MSKMVIAQSDFQRAIQQCLRVVQSGEEVVEQLKVFEFHKSDSRTREKAQKLVHLLVMCIQHFMTLVTRLHRFFEEVYQTFDRVDHELAQ